MEKTKLDRIIEAFRNLKEDGSGPGPGGAAIANSANAPGKGGGLGSNSPNKNMQGLDTKMEMGTQRRQNFTGKRKPWLDYLKNK
jgi:hypothetical protein